jgi:hypothetical protein
MLSRYTTARPPRSKLRKIAETPPHGGTQDPWWMFGMGGLFNGDKEEISGGGVATLEKPKAALARGSVEGLPRTYYDNYTAEDGKMGKDADGFYFLKEDQRVKINPFEKVRRFSATPSFPCSLAAACTPPCAVTHAAPRHGHGAPHPCCATQPHANLHR